ncbi:ATP-binding protein [Emticicia sp. BO119]|uniref:ATP-binding protein n=1 Tax=Emticicia sp. BO119 TaxID=2757768 RepID=UPI0015F11327|nr:ATP-binding protein [Emticicia sp. BO119]MBA4850018.1 tetratricopeptide repeat protein [Emticicia sp. BO119]
MNKYFLSFVLLFINWPCFGQLSRKDVDNWIEQQAYTNPENKDSLLIWSSILLKTSIALKYPRAEAYSIRMKGLFHDFNNNPTEATKYYLIFLEKSKSSGNISDEMSATSDLIYIYFLTNQLQKAKPLLLGFTNKTNKAELNQKKLAVFYNNLGIIYRKEGKEDSAIIAYRKCLKIRENLNDAKGLTNLKINLSSLLINKKRYAQALKLTEENILYLYKNKSDTDLWYNLINKAGALEGLKRYNESHKYLENAMTLAKQLQSKEFEKLTYEQFSHAYANQKKFEEAFEYLKKSNLLKEELLTTETNKKIAELRESFNANEREKQNQLLSVQIEVQKNKQNAYLIGIIALLLLSSVIVYTYYKNKSKNILISAQNQKLKDLNTEKNHLISIVSHDLSTPFSTIKLWVNSLDKTSTVKELEIIKINILKTVSHGLQTIKKILDIDKNELKEIDFVQIDLADLTRELVTLYEPILKQKKINFKVRVGHESETILSDKNMLFRLLGNLISNAIKFSNSNSEISLTTKETSQTFSFAIEDSGIGIEKSQLKNLFNRYSITSSKPTQDEDSTGLGLSIVKRLTDELGGEINVESETGKGTKFTVKFNK